MGLSPFRPIHDRIQPLRKFLPQGTCRLFGYSHDISADHTAQAALQCWPESYAFCYGDPPGFLYTQEEILRNAIAPSSVLRTLLAWRRVPDSSLTWRFADCNCVIVNFDIHTQASSRERCMHTPTYLVRALLKRLQAGIPSLYEKMQEALLIQAKGQSPCLLLLSNLTETGITTRANELTLYTQLIKHHAPPGTLILVKPHAGTSPQFMQQIVIALSAYRVIPLPKELAWLPVEMLNPLIMRSQIVSISSASALLATLYGRENIFHALSSRIITSFFAPDWHQHFLQANKAILEFLRGMEKTHPRKNQQSTKP